jgi:beta-lactamase regulating signal transducer with metallopeptidase domain
MGWISRMLVTFLVNSIAQVTIIAGLALLCSVALRRTAAKYQYVLWIAALLLSSLLPLSSLKSVISPHVSGGAYDAVKVTEPLRLSSARPNGTIGVGLWSWLSRSHEKQLLLSPILAALLAIVYSIFLVYRTLRLGFAWRHTRKLYNSASIHSTTETVRSLVESRAEAFCLKRTPRIYALDGIGPLTVGVRQPILLMPTKLMETAAEADFDSAVCHELAHISRNDFQVNLICEFVSMAVSFHPGAWFIKSRINQARELACDDLAAEKFSTPTLYAGALMHIAQSFFADSKNASSSLAQGLFDTNNMERRISNLMGERSRLGKTWGQILTLGVVGCLVGVTMGASAFSVRMVSNRMPQTSSSERSAHAEDNSPRRRIRISQITFVETTKTINETEIQAFAREIEGLQQLGQSSERWLDEVGERARAFWQNHGYFKVIVEANSKVVSDSPDEQVFSVAVTVNPGSQYRLKQVVFTGNTVFTTHELEAMFPISPGDIMNREKIAMGLKRMGSAYGAKGYKDCVFIPDTEIDEPNHAITLRIDIAERVPSK